MLNISFHPFWRSATSFDLSCCIDCRICNRVGSRSGARPWASCTWNRVGCGSSGFSGGSVGTKCFSGVLRRNLIPDIRAEQRLSNGTDHRTEDQHRVLDEREVVGWDPLGGHEPPDQRIVSAEEQDANKLSSITRPRRGKPRVLQAALSYAVEILEQLHASFLLMMPFGRVGRNGVLGTGTPAGHRMSSTSVFRMSMMFTAFD